MVHEEIKIMRLSNKRPNIFLTHNEKNKKEKEDDDDYDDYDNEEEES